LARSSSSAVVLLDRVALVGLGLGLLAYVAPFWSDGRLKLAFWLTLAATALHVYTSHARAGGQP
jgi:hypothetical protein